jgi:hypothetical protein
MVISTLEHQEVSNYHDILSAIREWPPSIRATLVTDVVATLVEDKLLLRPEDYETEEMRQIRLGWEAERAHSTLDEDEDLSWMDDLSQEQILARMKAEWEENRRRAHENYVPRPPRSTLAEIYGIGNAEHPGPSDEEVEQWLHEHKMEKYG